MSESQLDRWFERFDHTVGRARRSGDRGRTGRYRALLREQEDLGSENDQLQRQVQGLLALLIAKDQLLCPQGAIRYVPFLRLARRYEAEKTRQALIQWEKTALKGRIVQLRRTEATHALASPLTGLLHRLLTSAFRQMRVPRALQRLESRVKRRLLCFGFETIRQFYEKSAKKLQIRLKAFQSALSAYRSRSLTLYLYQIRLYRPKNWLGALLLVSKSVRKKQQNAFFQWIKACKRSNIALLLANHLTETSKIQRRWQSALHVNRLVGVYTYRRRIDACKCLLLWKFAATLCKNRVKTGLLVSKKVLKQALSRWIWPKPVFRPLLLPFLLRNVVKAQLRKSISTLHTAVSSHYREQLSLSQSQLSTSQASADIQLKQLQAEIVSLQKAALQAQADSDTQKQQCTAQLQQMNSLQAAYSRLEEQLGRSVQEKAKWAASVNCLSEEKAGLVEELRTRSDYFAVQRESLERRVGDLETALAASEARCVQKSKEHQSHCLSLQEEIKRVAREKAQCAAKAEELGREQVQVKGTSTQLAAQVLKLSKEIADLKVGTR